MSETRTIRRLVLVIAVILALAALVLLGGTWSEVQWGGVGTYDFVQYWGAARLLQQGDNPYDPAAMLAEQREVGWPEDQALMFWTPPWTLVLVWWLSFLPFVRALMAWVALGTVIVLGSGLVLWDHFRPRDNRRWLGMTVAFAFCPSLLALYMGQISPAMLLGVVGFLGAQRKGWDTAAGAFLAILMVKPHVTYLFWLAAVWWAWRYGRRRVLIGWLGALVGASGVVLAVAPGIFGNYLGAYRNPPLVWHSASLGTWLRLLVGWDVGWLQFVPSLIGGLGLLAWLWRKSGQWRWAFVTGPLLLASVVTAAYGWSFDQVVLLPAVVAVVAALPAKPRLAQSAILGALVATQVGLWAINRQGIPDAFNVWHAPLLAAIYWWTISPRLKCYLQREGASSYGEVRRTR